MDQNCKIPYGYWDIQKNVNTKLGGMFHLILSYAPGSNYKHGSLEKKYLLLYTHTMYI